MENKDLNTLPQIPEISTEAALNLLLASIAYEELGLTHILNAEAEKIKSVLGTHKEQQTKTSQTSELEKLSNSVDKILKDVIMKDMLLCIKLENILTIPRPAPSAYPAGEKESDAPSPEATGTHDYNKICYESTSISSDDLLSTSPEMPEGSQCTFSFTGSGITVVTNEEDAYHGHTVQIEEAKVCTNGGNIDDNFLKYKILGDQDYTFTAFPSTMHILPPNPFNPSPAPGNPNVMIIMGRGCIVNGSDEDEGQFTYIIRDGGNGVLADELQMVITAANNSSLNHNSGIMKLDGNINIKQISPQNGR